MTEEQRKEVLNKMDLSKCCHKLRNRNCSLEFFPLRFMVMPMKYFYVCKYCGQSFTFIKDDKGKLIPDPESEPNTKKEAI